MCVKGDQNKRMQLQQWSFDESCVTTNGKHAWCLSKEERHMLLCTYGKCMHNFLGQEPRSLVQMRAA